ncbi:MAG: PhoU family transcriptional regulator [Actinobacteria bacterium BACL2 MAG-120813-bin23]|jgi:phosphate transport system protein|uniref:Phosphate-specific transport system accessory protein PhoU n=2 Tax=ac1 cluster TaxID=1655545 RepID=A0A0R2NTG6_9ACTN|nr:MAG: PhoU family transcriptional regulator [Actinobacteria bacterium BACL2 MAG-120802-bin41]KRO43593.1 MAG: PhoU family transcriptional regulator [Actinobacteria bacterium BACL2 MAG-120813-bin23]MDP4615637.1 phosphate signaling complex protein PhoU [Candidatus Nanopelagicales bacterium]MDP4864619.1 phosphate signaling complex protein PhoU [Candidatus Nanopelagicaceae bacterium]MDP4931207.1 phosphate signaling complex protein PhoU [Candidatus Nanopelagicaceae bacterium]
MSWLRSAFQDELDGVTQSLLELSSLVSSAITQATHALLTADLSEAEAVIAADDRVDEIQHELDARIIDIIARQQPVASDLRALVTALRMSADLERMGDMAHHIAKITRLRHPGAAVPSELLLTIEEMGKVARLISDKVGGIIDSKDIDKALEVEKDDDEMDLLHRKLFTALLEPSWPHGIETAIDMTLIGRYYERYADHAVSVSRRIHFQVTGKYNNES